ncbi:MAG: T9SS type A sorting domain-containing protein [Paludibacteraceae bacterium]|nr:T9SS type A sorting domain-containing protein [Paludibacteraceae bacterium]
MRKITLFLSLVFATIAMAQVTTVPGIIQKGYDGEITVIFNPNEGNKGMVGATQCYAHTGIITSASSNDGDWKNVVEGWRANSSKTQLTQDGSNWKLVIPNIYEFYNCPTTTEIKKLAFVFHDGPNGSKEGKTAEGTDIFVELAEAGLAASIVGDIPEIASLGSTITLNCYATMPATLTLKLNGQVVKTDTGSEMAYTQTLDNQGNYNFELTVATADETATAIASTCVPNDPTKANRPAGIVNGIYYDKADDTKVTLCTYAGSKTEPAKHVFVVGDFNNWTISNDYQLKQANDSAYFWIELNGLTAQQEYAMQYVVVRADGVVKRISDLYSEKVLHKDDAWEPQDLDPDLMDYPLAGDGYVTVIQPGKPAFQWSEATLNFKRPNKNNLVIYELWVRDHTAHRSIEGLMERLDYFEDLGVNAIELMPVTEFDGNDSWGYSPNHYFALDKAYGTPEQLKTFIDECHKRGIAVILDMVFNHATGLNPMNKLYPYGTDLSKNPWFNATAPHSDNVYEDWNHDFAPTKTMFTRALQYWLEEYKVDGYRMDLSHGLCGTAANTSVKHIKEYYQNGVKAVSEDAYFILEHWGANMGSERPALIKEGMMCWDNTTNAYYQTAMGWLKDGDNLTNASKDDYVTYCESHDEERAFFKAKQWGNGDLKTNEEARAARVPLNMAFLTMLNGPKMFYHFAELGFDNSKYQNAQGKWGKNDYGIASELGADYDCKMQTKMRPEKWLVEGHCRMAAFQKVGQTIQLRTRIMPEVFEGNPTAATLGSGKALRTIQWGSNVFVAGNFDVAGEQTVTLPSGTWYNYFAQAKQTTTTVTLKPGEVAIFTGKEVKLPEMPAGYDFYTDVEDVVINTPSEMLPPYNVRVYNINGQLISSQMNAMSADLTGMKAGMYIVQYEKNGQRMAKKVIR